MPEEYDKNKNNTSPQIKCKAEISNYSLYVKGSNFTKEYAGIDKNSIPNSYKDYSNWNMGEYNNYPRQAYSRYTNGPGSTIKEENDESTAQGFKIVNAGYRTIEGIVFEDAPIVKDKLDGENIQEFDNDHDSKIGANDERIGDGIYGTNESLLSKDSEGNYIKDEPIKGVEVQLVDAETGEEAKVYDPDQEKFVYPDIKTSNDGTFSIKGFLPGNYKIVFVWGDNYGGRNVKDYKSTIYINGDYDTKTTLWCYNDENIRSSDAVDDYIRRLAIDHLALDTDLDGKYVQTENGDTEVELYTTQEKQAIQNLKNNTNEDLSIMKSATPKFVVGVEKEGLNEDGNGSSNVKFPPAFANGLKAKYEYKITNIDFGIVERPRNSMGVKKRITSIKINTADGRPIVIAKIGVDGKINAIAGESYISGGYDLEYLWAQIDKGIEQSMKVEIEYEIEVSCQSEIDYANKEYYLFGTNRTEATQVRLTAEGLYDYASGVTLMADQNIWQSVNVNSSSNNINKYLQSSNSSDNIVKTATEEEYLKMIANANGNALSEVQITDYINSKFNSYTPKQKATISKLFNKWKEAEIDTAKELREYKLEGREIIQGTTENYLTNHEYAPGDKETAKMKVSKELSVGEEIDINNDVEIAKASLKKTIRTARRVDMSAAPLYDSAEYVTVTPATGEDKDYVGWTIVAIGILTVLGSGIVLIRRLIK